MAQQAAIGQDLLEFMDALGIASAAARRLRLGWTRRVHRRDPGAGARPGARHDRRLQRAGHGRRAAGDGRGAGAVALVPVVPQHRARPRRVHREPPRALPRALARVVAHVALRGRGVRPRRRVVRQPRLRAGRRALLSPSPRQRAGRGALRGRRAAPGVAPPIAVPSILLHGADDTVSPPQRTEGHLALFPPGTERRVVAGAGHFMPREQPAVVADALLKLLR